jgi:hypothetical protein
MTADTFSRWARPQTVAETYGLSLRFLEQMRYRGDGPPFAKVGRAVLYDLREFETWLEQQKRRSTSAA